MPGKYSHSVVLADYSTRGIISLSTEQHKEFIASAPPSKTWNSPMIRRNGIRSAQGAYRPAAASYNAAQRRVVVKESSLSLSARDASVKARSALGPQTFQPPLPVQRPANLPQSLPDQPLPEAGSLTAYQRQQQALTQHVTTSTSSDGIFAKNNSKPVGALFSVNVSRDNQLGEVHKRYSKSYESLRRYAQELQEKTIAANTARAQAASPDAGLARPTTQADATTSTNNETTSTKTVPSKTNAGSDAASRIYSPVVRREYPDEPNFDDFSDTSATPLGYFDTDRGQNERNQTAIIDFVQRTPTRSDFQHDMFVQTVLHPPSKPNQTNHDALSQTTINSDSTPLSIRSNSASSSTSTTTITPNPPSFATLSPRSKPAAHKPSALSPRLRSTGTHDPPWLLPEIKEQPDFTPSIFEDTTPPRPTAPDFTISTLGQISSGRDVNFSPTGKNNSDDDDDASSEITSADFPPPITRFKDEQAEFEANMAKIFGPGVIGNSGKKSGVLGKGAGANKGFWGKFRRKG